MNIKKLMRNLAILASAVTVTIIAINKVIDTLSNLKEEAPDNDGKYFKWRYGNIYYTKSGHGKPLLLIHDLNTFSCNEEWSKVKAQLSENHTVYAVDLLGCGKSDKPNLTYTNYLYVQMVNEFIKKVIEEPTDVIATRDALSFVVMACSLEPDNFLNIAGVTPRELGSLAMIPNKSRNILKYIIDSPIIGTFIYYIIHSKFGIRKYVERLFFRDYMVPNDILDMSYDAAHVDGANGRYLHASIKSNYINVNIANALKNINNSICIIGGKEHPYMSSIMEEYKELNPSIELAYISSSNCLPHIENPGKFVELINIIM